VTDFVWPVDLIPSASEWRLVANTAAFASPLSGTTRTLARGGDRWACTMQFNALTGADRARLQAFLARLRGQANRVWVYDHSYRKRGSFASAELLPDPGNTAAASWTPTHSTVGVSDGIVRLTAGAHTAGQYPAATKTFPVASGATYVARTGFDYSSGGAATFGIYVAAGTADASALSTATGLRTVSFTSNGTTGSMVLYFLDTVAQDRYFDASYVSFSRCALISGANQTGSVVATDNIPSASDLLLPGDFVQIGDSLHMLTARYDANQGALHITPPLRTSPADNAPVIIHQPMARMMLADQTVGWSNVPGTRTSALSSITVEFVEDLL
jgi:hypothetical protein